MTCAGRTGITVKTLPSLLEARVAAAAAAATAAAASAAVAAMSMMTTRLPGGRESLMEIGRPVHPRLPRPRHRHGLSGGGLGLILSKIEALSGGALRFVGETPFYLLLPGGGVHHRGVMRLIGHSLRYRG